MKQGERMSEQNPRDTHFVGFAKAVERKLYEEHLLDLLHRETVFDASDAVIQILTRAAYDLAMHVLASPNGLNGRKTKETEEHYRAYLQEILQDDIPDLTELSKEE